MEKIGDGMKRMTQLKCSWWRYKEKTVNDARRMDTIRKDDRRMSVDNLNDAMDRRR